MAAPYEKIACFIDQDAASESALAEAQRLRGFGDCELNLVHIAPEPIALYSAPYAYLSVAEDFYPRAREWIEDRARRARATPVLLSGLPARAACDFATSAGVDLMIAAAHQGRGHGRSAVLQAIDRIREVPSAQELKVSVAPDEGNAVGFYERLGFVDTGEVHDGEMVFVLPLR